MEPPTTRAIKGFGILPDNEDASNVDSKKGKKSSIQEAKISVVLLLRMV